MNRPLELPLPPRPRPRWTAALALRMRRLLLLKVVGVSVFTWIFFIGYFHLLRHPAFAVTVMPLTALDHWIAFRPQALAAYLTLWFYIGIAPGLLLSVRELVVYGLWAAALCTTGLACFYFWPTAVPAQLLDVSGLPGFGVLQGVDAAGNACPSLHVATAMFSAIWIDRLLRRIEAPAWPLLLNALWFGAIAWSTLAIKQHVVLDVLAGAALGIAFAWPSLRFSPAAGRPRRGRGRR